MVIAAAGYVGEVSLDDLPAIRGWLYAVGVLEDHRCTGIGAALVQHVLKELKVMGCRKVNLQIRATNSGVAAFYKSLGFEIEERLSMGTLIE